MSLLAYNKAKAIIDGDLWCFIYGRLVSGSPGGDPDSIYDRFIKEFIKFGYWLWDPFEFATMTIDDAIDLEAPNHVLYNPTGILVVNSPMVTYKLDSKTAQAYNYSVSIYDESEQSDVAERFAEKFKMAAKGEPVKDGDYYRFDYSMSIVQKDE